MLSKIFNKHNLHYAHYAMMAGMVFAAVAAMPATATAATLPDLALATVDASWSMLEGLANTFDVAGGVLENTANGDFSLNYEWGSMDHSGHAAEAASHVSHAANPSAAVDPSHASHVTDVSHVGHEDACSVKDMIAWEQSEPDLAFIDEEIEAGSFGSRAEYFSQFCHDHS